MEKKEPLDAAGVKVKWYSQYAKHYGASSKKQKLKLPHDPAVSLLGIHI